MLSKGARIALLSGALFATLSTAALAGAKLTDPETGESFAGSQTVWGKEWVGVGVGTREKYTLNVYSMALYVEKERGAPALKAYLDGAGKAYNTGGKIDISKARADSKLALSIVECACGRGVDIRFVRAVAGPDIKKSTLEGLARQIDINGADVKDDMQKLGDFLNYDAKVGTTLKFYFSAGGKLSLTGPGGDLKLANPKINRALLSNWIGPNHLQDDLRDGLLSKVNTLLE
jgi:hypothetical protein